MDLNIEDKTTGAIILKNVERIGRQDISSRIVCTGYGDSTRITTMGQLRALQQGLDLSAIDGELFALDDYILLGQKGIECCVDMYEDLKDGELTAVIVFDELLGWISDLKKLANEVRAIAPSSDERNLQAAANEFFGRFVFDSDGTVASRLRAIEHGNEDWVDDLLSAGASLFDIADLAIEHADKGNEIFAIVTATDVTVADASGILFRYVPAGNLNCSPPHYQGYVKDMQWLETMQHIPTYKDKPDVFLGAVELQVRKYLDRYKAIESRLDGLKKARWYLDFMIKYIENDCKPVDCLRPK